MGYSKEITFSSANRRKYISWKRRLVEKAYIQSSLTAHKFDHAFESENTFHHRCNFQVRAAPNLFEHWLLELDQTNVNAPHGLLRKRFCSRHVKHIKYEKRKN